MRSCDESESECNGDHVSDHALTVAQRNRALQCHKHLAPAPPRGFPAPKSGGESGI
jgi:hypothetical protein